MQGPRCSTDNSSVNHFVYEVEKIFGPGNQYVTTAKMILQAITFSNMYAPEHLIINVKDAEKWESFIENAGPWTPESVGDYASGTNHVLPTYGYARMYNGVSLDSFLKYITVQSLTEEGLRKV
ncbi:histidinol dehydrogenase, chloroplastic-like isoform X2 [Vicia villosa]|uniref:histidinol dehydrogenase, chloroplastic-like isoform X2 n=1 Tax=Vicia villosa TaxID=3911 RepID=UPI00273C8E32|nr:histidinol dehydrogenase, chloroplastic-like isoform X2 [Vicia villosa]XP_058751057.1 histidinol dehydrogenase, chloroplastic-like isoform X2 [Vicia villosa]XP_058751058.1 histidinol dehydrogenase, chloroplastic-like isoform X2 [Vicia villosa]